MDMFSLAEAVGRAFKFCGVLLDKTEDIFDAIESVEFEEL